jgi:Patatin-like phospholipase
MRDFELPLTLAEVLFEELETTHESQVRELQLAIEEIREVSASDLKQVETICEREKLEIDTSSKDLVATYWACKQALSANLLPRLYQVIHGLPNKRSALCLSGGGVQNATFNLGVVQALLQSAGPKAPHLRSATFNLGILQGLARCGLLDKFDYLSTTSGGSFIGSWLMAWIQREGTSTLPVERVVSRLALSSTDPLVPEPQPVRNLRLLSNHLTPNTGLLSLDTWNLVGVYLRNLLPNWLVFVPVIMAFLMLPRISVAFIKGTFVSQPVLLVVGFVGATIALVYVWLTVEGPTDVRFRERWFVALFLTLAATSAIAFTTYLIRFDGHLGFDRWNFIRFALALGAVSWGFSLTIRLFARRRDQVRGNGFRMVAFYATATSLILGAFAVGGFVVWYAVTLTLLHAPPVELRWYASLAVPISLIALSVGSTLIAGFTSRFTSVDDLEWWWRLSAGTLVVALAWGVFHILVLFGPSLIFQVLRRMGEGTWTLDNAKGLATTLVVLFSAAITLFGGFGENQPTELDTKAKIVGFVRSLSAAIVVALIIVFLSILTNWILAAEFVTWVARLLDIQAMEFYRNDFAAVMYSSSVRLLLLFVVFLALVGALVGRLINANRLSLHYYWRNRIMQTYLGASRRPNGASTVDQPDGRDNFQMHELRHKPLHVINLTLNRQSRDRRRESFTVSPLHSGSYRLGHRRSRHYGGENGISLATAAALSGSGVSPNMGDVITPALVRFIMVFFNVRLGSWLGNPGIAGSGTSRLRTSTFSRDSPVESVRPIFAEALGLTSARNQYVHLSDGGHFENLGLYEMILRRCKLIVVSDVSTDPYYGYQSLANAIRLIRTDLGVPIEMLSMRFGKAPDPHNRYCAIGVIRYSAVDSSGGADKEYDGQLIYIKPSLNGSEPRDVLTYLIENSEFPQDSRSDQGFGDAQYESYRVLGSHMIETICSERLTTAAAPLELFGRQAQVHVTAADSSMA